MFLRTVSFVEIRQPRYCSPRKSKQSPVKENSFGFGPGRLIISAHRLNRLFDLAGVNAPSRPFHGIVVFRVAEKSLAMLEV